MAFLIIMVMEVFQTKKQGYLGNAPNRGGGIVKKSKKSQVSVGKSSKLGGGSSEIQKVPSSRRYQFQRVSLILIDFVPILLYSTCFEEFLGGHSASKNPKFKKVPS